MLVLAARREERLKKLQEEIQSSGGHAIYHVTDVASYEQMEALAELVLKEFGKIDVNIKGVLYGIAAVLPTIMK